VYHSLRHSIQHQSAALGAVWAATRVTCPPPPPRLADFRLHSLPSCQGPSNTLQLMLREMMFVLAPMQCVPQNFAGFGLVFASTCALYRRMSQHLSHTTGCLAAYAGSLGTTSGRAPTREGVVGVVVGWEGAPVAAGAGFVIVASVAARGTISGRVRALLAMTGVIC
jgi:hypothetical protein